MSTERTQNFSSSERWAQQHDKGDLCRVFARHSGYRKGPTNTVIEADEATGA